MKIEIYIHIKMTSNVQIISDGITGFVMLKNGIAIKHMEAPDLYWPTELSIHYYLKPFITENIVKLIDSELGPMEFDCESMYLEQFPDNSFVKLKFIQYKHINEITIKHPYNLIQFLLDITSGLSLLHKHDIIHRDLKLKNILYDGKKYIIIDFSNSYKIVPCCSNYRDEVTTITHEAPEITKARVNKALKIKYTSAIDMWSLGIILIDILSEGKATTEIITHKTQGNIENFIISLVDSKHALDKYIWRHTGAVEATHDIFIKWIRAMLVKNTKRRITAPSLYNLVKRYAEGNNIAHRVPINTERDIIEMLNSEISPYKTVNGKLMQIIRRIGKTESGNIFNTLPNLNLHYPTITEAFLQALRHVIFNVVYDRNIYVEDGEDDDDDDEDEDEDAEEIIIKKKKRNEVIEHMFIIIKQQIGNIYRSCELPKDIIFTDSNPQFLEF